jgi:hypothetical protein
MISDAESRACLRESRPSRLRTSLDSAQASPPSASPAERRGHEVGATPRPTRTRGVRAFLGTGSFGNLHASALPKGRRRSYRLSRALGVAPSGSRKLRFEEARKMHAFWLLLRRSSSGIRPMGRGSNRVRSYIGAHRQHSVARERQVRWRPDELVSDGERVSAEMEDLTPTSHENVPLWAAAAGVSYDTALCSPAFVEGKRDNSDRRARGPSPTACDGSGFRPRRKRIQPVGYGAFGFV